jgi:chorismate mutase
MRPLRTQVDKIDRKILRLLQQRIKLSRRIGAVKRRHGAPVYVPEREREVLRKVALLSRGQLSPRAARAIFREILSSSRAEQRQPPIGLLRASADAILPTARWCFGACDEFELHPAWCDLAKGLADGSLVVALVAGADLAKILATGAKRHDFPLDYFVVGELPPADGAKPGLMDRVFIVMPKLPEIESGSGDNLLFLIECKSPGDKVKRWFESMTASSFYFEKATVAQNGRSRHVLVHVAGRNIGPAVDLAQSGGLSFSIVGIYKASEDYAG